MATVWGSRTASSEVGSGWLSGRSGGKGGRVVAVRPDNGPEAGIAATVVGAVVSGTAGVWATSPARRTVRRLDVMPSGQTMGAVAGAGVIAAGAGGAVAARASGADSTGAAGSESFRAAGADSTRAAGGDSARAAGVDATAAAGETSATSWALRTVRRLEVMPSGQTMGAGGLAGLTSPTVMGPGPPDWTVIAAGSKLASGTARSPWAKSEAVLVGSRRSFTGQAASFSGKAANSFGETGPNGDTALPSGSSASAGAAFASGGKSAAAVSTGRAVGGGGTWSNSARSSAGSW